MVVSRALLLKGSGLAVMLLVGSKSSRRAPTLESGLVGLPVGAVKFSLGLRKSGELDKYALVAFRRGLGEFLMGRLRLPVGDRGLWE